MSFPFSCSASAPGKVLLSGGYLVLQRGLAGLVVASSSRFRARALWASDSDAAFADVLGASASVFARAQLLAATNAALNSVAAAAHAGAPAFGVVVASPQFHAAWGYAATASLPVSLSRAAHDNNSADGSPFAEAALDAVLSVAVAAAASVRGGASALSTESSAHAASSRVLLVVVDGDNDFYSQSETLRARGAETDGAAALRALPPSVPLPFDESSQRVRVRKTGLGSSAALTVAIVGAALGVLGVVRSPLDERGRHLIHATAQAAHGRAQGKVGSGFDVAAAVFGSISYARVPPDALRDIMDSADGERAENGYGTRLLSAAASGEGGVEAEDGRAWSFSAAPWSLPAGLRLALADVAGGSGTPDMVRRVLAWRDAPHTAGDDGTAPAEAASDPLLIPSKLLGADYAARVIAAEMAARAAAVGPPLWRNLAAANSRLLCATELLGALSDGSDEYARALRVAAQLESTQWMQRADADTDRALAALAEVAFAFSSVRAALGGVGRAAGVGIEPPEQTARAKATLAVPGVVAAGVPGAGGLDALFAVHIDDADGADGRPPVRAAVEACWHTHGLTPLLIIEGPARGTAGAGVVVDCITGVAAAATRL